jgi:hypothetical protein
LLSIAQSFEQREPSPMPHDAAPRNGGTYESGVPGWVLALAIAVFFSFAATVLAAATGAFLILLAALGLVGLGCGLYALVAARRRRRRFGFGMPPQRWHMIRDARPVRRHSRLAGDPP